jgi:hypothetical protein
VRQGKARFSPAQRLIFADDEAYLDLLDEGIGEEMEYILQLVRTSPKSIFTQICTSALPNNGCTKRYFRNAVSKMVSRP